MDGIVEHDRAVMTVENYDCMADIKSTLAARGLNAKADNLRQAKLKLALQLAKQRKLRKT